MRLLKNIGKIRKSLGKSIMKKKKLGIKKNKPTTIVKKIIIKGKRTKNKQTLSRSYLDAPNIFFKNGRK